MGGRGNRESSETKASVSPAASSLRKPGSFVAVDSWGETLIQEENPTRAEKREVERDPRWFREITPCTQVGRRRNPHTLRQWMTMGCQLTQFPRVKEWLNGKVNHPST